MMELREEGGREALQARTIPQYGEQEQDQNREPVLKEVNGVSHDHPPALNEYQSGYLKQIPALAQPSGNL